MKTFLITVLITALSAAGAYADGSGKSCSHDGKKAAANEKGKHSEHASCPIKGEHTMQPVKLTGSVVCLHCNLHQQDKCEKVFQTADAAKTIYSLCPMGDNAAIEAAAEHGAAVLEVEGHLMTAGDGASMLMIQKFTKTSQ